MKRDMDLVREILMAVEDSGTPLPVADLVSQDHGIYEVVYHVNLLDSHGLIDGPSEIQVLDEGNLVRGKIDGLTWDGHDYLDAIRDKKVWAKTKQVIKETIGSTTLSVIKQVAEKVALSMALNAIGMV